MQVEIYKELDALMVDGSVVLPSTCMPIDKADGIYEFTPTPPFWRLWHEIKQEMRDAGFMPYKDEHGIWCGRWCEAVYENHRR